VGNARAAFAKGGRPEADATLIRYGFAGSYGQLNADGGNRSDGHREIVRYPFLTDKTELTYPA
jgi:hypothetical protein